MRITYEWRLSKQRFVHCFAEALGVYIKKYINYLEFKKISELIREYVDPVYSLALHYVYLRVSIEISYGTSPMTQADPRLHPSSFHGATGEVFAI